MVKNDYVHGAYHKDLAKEIERVLLECEKAGIFVNKKESSALVSQKSRRGIMTPKEIIAYIKKMRKTFNYD